MRWLPHLTYILLILIGRICDATRLDTRRIFAKGLYGFRKLTAFHGVKLTECEEQCFHRKSCRGILYNRQAHLCTLTDVKRRQLSVFMEHDGTVVAYNFRRLRQRFSTEICESCKAEQTCLATEEGHICKATECGAPPSIYTELWGNMFSVNNTLVVHWDRTDYPIICGEDGLWAAANSPCLPGWTRFDSSCYFLDKTWTIQSDAKDFCEQLRPGTHLAYLNTPSEDEFVRTWLKQQQPLQPSDPNTFSSAWLGGKRNIATSEFAWSDGTVIGYRHWDNGQPNAESSEGCLLLLAHEYRWHDAPCDIKSLSLCEYTLVNSSKIHQLIQP